MYRVEWSKNYPEDVYGKKVQYLADVYEVVRDAFGVEGAEHVLIKKEDS